MSDIDRLYCTHCTFGTSALETATADNAAKVLGYSVRASSLPDADRSRLRQVFRSIERLLSYDLPRDASAADKEKLDAASAPRRLIFLPTLGDCQVVGQVSYRSRDTAGRPGSYFADMLVSRLNSGQPERAWSPAECLELWAADHTGTDRGGWWCDSEETFAERSQEGDGKPVPPVASVTEIRAAADPDRKPLVSIDVLQAFLFREDDAIGPHDPGGVIPPRWRELPADSRREFFARLLQAAIGILGQGGKAVVLAVEPSLAALLFYGVCRLLPPKLTKFSGGQSGISFSTYEPFPERPMTSLVATTFLHGGAAVDLPADVYQRGFACNTFLPDFNSWQSAGGRGRVPDPQAFVRRILDLLALGDGAGGAAVAAVDELLGAIDGLGKPSPLSLDGLIRIDDFVTKYAGGRQPLAALDGGPRIKPNSDDDTFRRRRFQKLIEEGEAEGRTDWPEDLLPTAIDWLGDTQGDTQGDTLGKLWRANGGIARVLRRQLPTTPQRLKELAKARPPEEVVRDAVISVAEAERRLPDCLPEILGGFKRFAPDDKAVGALVQIIAGLAEPLRQEILLASNPTLLGDAILTAITSRECRQPAGVVEKLFCRVLDDGDRPVDGKWSALVTHAKLADSLPRPARDLAERLDALFSGLRASPPAALAGKGRADAVARLEAWTSLTTDWNRNRETLLGWKAVFDSLGKLTDAAEERAGAKFRLGGSSGAADMAAKAVQALDKLNGEPAQQAWTPQLDDRRRRRLSQSLQVMQPPPAVREIAGQWIDGHLKREQKQATAVASSGLRKELMLALAIAVPVMLVAALAGLAWYSGAARDWLSIGDRTAKNDTRKPKKNPAGSRDPPQADPSEDGEKGPRTAGLVANSTNSLKNESNAVDPKPDPVPPLTGDDIGLKMRFERGEAVVTWNNEALKGTKRRLSLTGPNLAEDQRKPVDVSEKPEHRTRAGGFGEYRATLSAQRGDEPEIEAPAAAKIDQPPAPVVAGIDLDLGTPDKPQLRVSIKNPPDLRVYGVKECVYCVQSGGEEVGRGPSPEAGATVIIPIRTDSWTPQRLQEAQCELVIKAPQGDGKPSDPQRVKADVAGFMKGQLKPLTSHGVSNVWPLEPDKDGRVSSKPVPLHPFVAEGKVTLDLLTPDYSDPVTLTLHDAGKEVWKVEQKPRTPPQRTSLDVESSKTSAESAVPADDAPKGVACGGFRIDRGNPWNPLLRYLDPTSAGETPDSAADKLAGWRLAAGKLAIGLADYGGARYELQLMNPIAVPPIVLDLQPDVSGKYSPRRLELTQLQSVVSQAACTFRCEAPEAVGKSGVEMDLRQESNAMRLSVSQGEEIKADAKLTFSSTKKPPKQEIMLGELEWAECKVFDKEFQSLPPRKGETVSPPARSLSVKNMLLNGRARGNKQDIATVNFVLARLWPNNLSKELMLPSAVHKRLKDEREERRKVHEKGGDEAGKTELQNLDFCIDLVEPLKEREEKIAAFLGELPKTKAAVRRWVITGRVKNGGAASDVTIMVCDPTMEERRFGQQPPNGSRPGDTRPQAPNAKPEAPAVSPK